MTYDLTYLVQDDKNLTSLITIPVPSQTAVADLLGALDAIGQLIMPLVKGGLKAAAVRIAGSVTGWDLTDITANSDVQEIGTFLFNTTGPVVKETNLPTFDETLLVANSKVVDTSDADVAAFITAMESGVTVNAHVIEPCNKHAEDILSIASARETWGKERK